MKIVVKIDSLTEIPNQNRQFSIIHVLVPLVDNDQTCHARQKLNHPKEEPDVPKKSNKKKKL